MFFQTAVVLFCALYHLSYTQAEATDINQNAIEVASEVKVGEDFFDEAAESSDIAQNALEETREVEIGEDLLYEERGRPKVIRKKRIKPCLKEYMKADGKRFRCKNGKCYRYRYVIPLLGQGDHCYIKVKPRKGYVMYYRTRIAKFAENKRRRYYGEVKFYKDRKLGKGTNLRFRKKYYKKPTNAHYHKTYSGENIYVCIKAGEKGGEFEFVVKYKRRNKDKTVKIKAPKIIRKNRFKPCFVGHMVVPGVPVSCGNKKHPDKVCYYYSYVKPAGGTYDGDHCYIEIQPRKGDVMLYKTVKANFPGNTNRRKPYFGQVKFYKNRKTGRGKDLRWKKKYYATPADLHYHKTYSGEKIFICIRTGPMGGQFEFYIHYKNRKFKQSYPAKYPVRGKPCSSYYMEAEGEEMPCNNTKHPERMCDYYSYVKPVNGAYDDDDNHCYIEIKPRKKHVILYKTVNATFPGNTDEVKPYYGQVKFWKDRKNSKVNNLRWIKEYYETPDDLHYHKASVGETIFICLRTSDMGGQFDFLLYYKKV